MIGLDTNVMIRHLLGDEPGQTKLVDKLLDQKCSADEPAFVNRIVLCETVWTLDRTYGYSRHDIARIVEGMLLARAFEVEDRERVFAALAVYRTRNVGFSDALICAMNRAHGCDFTATFNRKAGKVEGFRLLS